MRRSRSRLPDRCSCSPSPGSMSAAQPNTGQARPGPASAAGQDHHRRYSARLEAFVTGLPGSPRIATRFGKVAMHQTGLCLEISGSGDMQVRRTSPRHPRPPPPPGPRHPSPPQPKRRAPKPAPKPLTRAQHLRRALPKSSSRWPSGSPRAPGHASCTGGSPTSSGPKECAGISMLVFSAKPVGTLDRWAVSKKMSPGRRRGRMRRPPREQVGCEKPPDSPLLASVQDVPDRRRQHALGAHHQLPVEQNLGHRLRSAERYSAMISS